MEGGNDFCIAQQFEQLQIFNDKQPQFNGQYFELYQARLSQLGSRVKQQAVSLWQDFPLVKVCECKIGDKCIISGILIRKCQQRPSVIEKYIDQLAVGKARPSIIQSYASLQDDFFIEDFSGRLQLKIEQHQESFIQGVVLAILGILDDSGNFDVLDYCFPGLNQIDRQLPQQDDYICIISGLQLGSELFEDYLIELLQQLIEQTNSISQVVFLGNSLFKPQEAISVNRTSILQSNQAISQETLQSLQDLDTFIATLCQKVPVILIPGESDPTNLSLPQNPLKKCIFPFSSAQENFISASNPYFLQQSGINILFSSGQNIQSMKNYSNTQNSMELIKYSLEFSHLAVHSPDSLLCAPFNEKDPLVIEQYPHCYITGNMDQFQQEEYNGIQLIQAPKFTDQPHGIILLNKRDLNARLIKIQS